MGGHAVREALVGADGGPELSAKAGLEVSLMAVNGPCAEPLHPVNVQALMLRD